MSRWCRWGKQVDKLGLTNGRKSLPPRSPNLNAYAERWVRSVKEECLSRLILFGEASLRHALTHYVEHFHHERNHQGKGNVLLFPTVRSGTALQSSMQCREQLGGLLKYLSLSRFLSGMMRLRHHSTVTGGMTYGWFM